MTLRAGRADLHQRLDKASRTTLAWWAGLAKLLIEAAGAVHTCPHLDCAYCYAVEHQEAR